jgi:glucokinase
LSPASRSNLICAVDLGGTNLRAATIDREGQIQDRFKMGTPDSEASEDILNAIEFALARCDWNARQRGAHPTALSVVVPGSVHRETGVIVNAPNVPAIVNTNLVESLTRRQDLSVSIENDANAAALGEMWKGTGRGYQTIVCFTLGTGVGSGVILNGELWRGIDGTGGEIGHTSVDPFGGVSCKCGSFGCLEVYASATAIVRIAQELLPEYPQSSLHTFAAVHLTAKEIAAAAHRHDDCALAVFEKMGTHLGVGIANVVNALNPEAIVIGGGVSAAFDLFAPRAREEMMKRAFPVPAQRCQILKAECGDDAGLLGAAWLAFQKK